MSRNTSPSMASLCPENSLMSHPILEKIQIIDEKINHLKQQQEKLSSQLEQKILKNLHRQDAFSYDLDTLLGGIQYVLQTMKGTDEPSRKICAIWKSMMDENKAKRDKNHTQPITKEAA